MVKFLTLFPHILGLLCGWIGTGVAESFKAYLAHVNPKRWISSFNKVSKDNQGRFYKSPDQTVRVDLLPSPEQKSHGIQIVGANFN